MAEEGQQGPKPRLMIREMILENFKSYAGEQHVGPFHKCFSSVVGPNGSGKSNVIDAMLFVFGRRAKQLRFNKVSELIHNSAAHRNLEQARVTVCFQEIIDKEDDEYELVPGSEFTVARTANRNNTSDYYANGRKMSAKEVVALLKAKGIDLDNNRFLILQGEVEQISLMAPKGQDKGETGLLEYLEDIIGTDGLIPQIEEAAKALEALTEERQKLISSLKGAEKEVEGLQGKKLEAEAYLGKQAERLRMQMRGNRIHLHRQQKALAEVEAKSGEFSSRLDHERSKAKVFAAELAAVEVEYATADKALQQAQKALEGVQAEYKECEHKDTKVRMDLKHLRAKLKKLAAKRAEDAEAARKLEAETENLKEVIPAKREEIEEAGEQLAAAEAKLEQLVDGIKGEVEGYHQQLAKVRSELSPWEAQMTEVQSRIDVACSERDLLHKKAADAKERLEAARTALEAAGRAAEEKMAEIQKLGADVEAARHAADAERAAAAAAAAKEAKLEASMAELRGRCGAARAEVEAATSASGVVRVLLEAKRNGQLPGLLGRLGDLGAIDAKYDVAVSTAAPALDYVVVETTADAQHVVELLRRGGHGVATCLILEKQRHLVDAMNAAAQPPKGARRLFDLVRCSDDKARLAFWYALRNTLVTDSLEAATAIAYGGGGAAWGRVVTLEGQMIAESGAMSGGGSRPRGGRMRVGTAAPSAGGGADGRAAAAELARLEGEVAAGEGALREARDAKEAAERGLGEAERALRRLEVALPKAQAVAEAKRELAADLQRRLADLEAATQVSGEDTARAAELSDVVSRETAALAQLRVSCSGLQKQAAALTAKMEGAGGEPLKRQRALVAKLQKQVATTEADVAKMGVQLKAATKQLEKLRKDAHKQVVEEEKVTGEVDAGAAALKELEVVAREVLDRTQRQQEALAAAEAAVEEVRGRRDEKAKHVGVVHGVEVEVEAALEKLRAAKREHTAEAKRLRRAVEADAAQLQQYLPPRGDAEGGEAGEGGGPQVEMGEEELEAGNPDECFYQVTILEEQLRSMSPDLDAIEAYRSRAAELGARQAQLAELSAQRDQARNHHESLRKARLDGFMSGFNAISLKLKEMYQMITLGGDAELELVDTLDPFSEGIVFSVRPPKKSWKAIANLSGGEKTLSSLSLVFALHHYKPTPLYVMDEIDAALDFKNVSIVGHYIKERTKNAQFIIISLRNNMFELADRLVGIYKTDNATKTVTINPGQFAVGSGGMAQQQQQRGDKGAGARDQGAEPVDCNQEGKGRVQPLSA